MPALKKFLFDTSFDRPEEPEEEKVPEVEESEPEEEALPTYSEEEVNAAREEGFAAGKKEGIAEAANATEHQIMELLKKMEGQFTELFRMQSESNSATAHDATTVAVVVARKILPDLNQRNALGEVERFAEMALEKAIQEPHVVMRVNPQMHGSLAERIDALIAGKEYGGQIKLIADDDIPVGDCRMEWRNGGAERNIAAKMREIDEIIERNLGSSVTGANGAAGESETVAGEGLESIDAGSHEPPPEQSQEILDEANAEDGDMANIEEPDNAAGMSDADQGPESGQAAAADDGGETAAIGEDETAATDMPAPSGEEDGAEETAADGMTASLGEGFPSAPDEETNADTEQAVSSPEDG